MAEIIISGNFTDPSGAPQAGARIDIVLIRNSGTAFVGMDVSQITGENGEYAFNLSEGIYRVFVSYGNDSRKVIIGVMNLEDGSEPGTLNDYVVFSDPVLATPTVYAEIREWYKGTRKAARDVASQVAGVSDAAQLASAQATQALQAKGIAVAAKQSATQSAEESLSNLQATVTERKKAEIAASNAQSIADANTYFITNSDPDGTVAGLAGTPVGKIFRIAQGVESYYSFIYYANNNGVALRVTQVKGTASIPLITQDLNNVNVAGDYVQAQPANAIPARNYPVSSAGTLIVGATNSSNVFQTYLTAAGIYSRQFANSAWGSWVKTGTSSTLLTNENLNDIISSGIFVQNNSSNATSARSYPVVNGGMLIVAYTSDNSYVSQMYSAISGVFVRQRVLGVWSAWAQAGEFNTPSAGTANLNDVIKPGIYIQQTGSVATVGRNYPVSRGGTLILTTFGTSYYVQTYLTISGSYIRHYTGGAWGEWVQIGGIVSTGLGTSNLNDISSPGIYVQNQSGSATTGRSYPVARGGSLVVTYAASTNYISQIYYTISGIFVRHFATGAWSSWMGYASMDAVNAAISSGQSTASRVRMVVHGSSTLNYMNNELSALASKYGMAFLSGAVGGYTAQSTGCLTGQNKITVAFPGGIIPAASQVATNVTYSWNSMGLSALAVTLSNGVKGALTAAGLFTANNLSEDLTDVAGQVFTATATNWQGEFRGTYIISIGKNNVSSSTNNANTIIGYIDELIDGLPSWTPFVLVGFFSNYGETSQHIANVDLINATLKAKYGIKFIDINKYILSDDPFIYLGITKTPEDEAAIAARTLPPSLSRNSAHVSEPMDQLLTNMVESSLISLGYVSL